MDVRYEKHENRLFLGKLLPFIFHRDTLNDTWEMLAHWHENPEFLLCRSGKGRVLIASDWYAFSAGTLLCVPPGELHRVENNAAETLHYDCLIVDVSFCNENGLMDEQMHFTADANDPVATKLFCAAADACAAAVPPLDVLRIRVAVLQFLLYMAQHHAAAPIGVKSDSASAEVKKVMLYVKNYYADPLTLAQAAEIAGFSLYYFSHEFKRVTGMSFLHYLNSVRIERATALLQEGVGVTETCFRCGFKDLSYFSRTYKKLTGKAPSRVRSGDTENTP